MASINKYKNGWRALINKKGVRKSKIFNNKTAAKEWASRIEYQIDNDELIITKKTLHDLLIRYRDTKTINKRSARFETNKINHILTTLDNINLNEVSRPHFAEWRDKRLITVSDASVSREMTIVNTALNTAVNEWEWIAKNPMQGVKKPKQAQPRDRLITEKEIELITLTTGYQDFPQTISSRVGGAFLFAIETGMRAGEIVNTESSYVNLDKRTLHIPISKNGSSRDVALSSEAISILDKVDCNFNLTSSQLDSIFRKSKSMAGIENLHFHDTRHQAITNLAKKMDVLDLARMVGIKDLKILMIYYNETAENIAKLLD